MNNNKILLFLWTFVIIFFYSLGALAGFIKDEEIESFVQEVVDSVSVANKDVVHKIKVVIVDDQSFNAFVVGGNVIYVNLGLLKKIDDYNQLAAVIAHELAHIKLGHVARMDENIHDAKKLIMLTYACTALLALMNKGANSDAMAALMYGGESAAYANVLYHSRSHEIAADINAAESIYNNGYDPYSFVSLLKIMERESSASTILNPYLSTHPLNRERIDYIISYLEGRGIKNDYKKTKANLDRQEYFYRIKAKIDAFTNNIDVMKKKQYSNSCLDRYIKSIILYREGFIKEAIGLLQEYQESCHKDDPYVYELKGHFLRHINLLQDSKSNYIEALKKTNKDAVSIKISLVEVLKEIDTEEDLNFALEILMNIIANDPDNPISWYLLGEVQHKRKDYCSSYLALAEHSLLFERYDMTKRYIILAKKYDDRKKESNTFRIKEIEYFLRKI